MSYETTNRGPRNRARIDLSWEYERRDWAKSLGVNEHDLRNAVSVVGNDADKVREYLKHRKHPSG